MSTNSRKYRKTKQVRMSEDLHKKAKFLAVERGITISRLIDEVFINYFGKEANKKYEIT